MKKLSIAILAVIFALVVGYFWGQGSSPPDTVKRSASVSRSLDNNSSGSYSFKITATPSPKVTSLPKPTGVVYVINKTTKKFHYSWCSSVKQMLESNKRYSYDSRDKLIANGYDPCGRCHP